MLSFLSNFSPLDHFFLVCACVGTFFVFIKFSVNLVGFDSHAITDAGIDDLHTDSDVGFRLLSLYGLSSFFMMFGFVGLALSRQSQVGMSISIAGATVAGFASSWIIGKIFKIASRLQSSGTLQTSDALGCDGTVYLSIPQNGVGRVTINIHNRLCEVDATAKNGNKIDTGTLVKVVGINGSTFLVEQI